MKLTWSKSFLVGFFFLITFSSLVFVILVIQDLDFQKNPGKKYILQFDSIGNISNKSRVVIYGDIRIGKVDHLSFDLNHALVYITITDPQVNSWLSNGQKVLFSIHSSSLFGKGNILISFDHPNAKPIPIPKNSSIPIIPAYSPKTISSIIENTDSITRKVDNLVVNEALQILKKTNQLLDSPQLNQTFFHLKQFSSNIDQISQTSLPNTFRELNQLFKSTNQNIQSLFQSIQKIVDQTENKIYNSDGLLEQFKQLIHHSDQTVISIQSLVQKFEKQDNLVGTLTSDQKFSQEFKEIISNLKQITQGLKNNFFVTSKKSKKPF